MHTTACFSEGSAHVASHKVKQIIYLHCTPCGTYARRQLQLFQQSIQNLNAPQHTTPCLQDCQRYGWRSCCTVTCKGQAGMAQRPGEVIAVAVCGANDLQQESQAVKHIISAMHTIDACWQLYLTAGCTPANGKGSNASGPTHTPLQGYQISWPARLVEAHTT